MIPIANLLYGIDRKLNKVSSGNHQNISLPDKILSLREGTLRLIKKKLNPGQLGFDSFSLRYEDLQNLVVQYEKVTPTPTTEIYPSVQIDLTQLAYKHFLPVAITCKASRGECTGRLIEVPRIVKHSDLSTFLNNTNFNPSFEYQETLAEISGDKLIIYTGDFTIQEVEYSYLRYPAEVDSEGFEWFDGTPSTTVNSDLAPHLEDELLEMVIRELGFDTSNIERAQASEILDKHN